jgi:hypothetical protein
MDYLYKVNGGRWAISRNIGRRTVYLIESTEVGEQDMVEVLAFLGISPENTSKYFPVCPKRRVRVPSLLLLNLLATYIGGYRSEVGV